MGTTTMLRSKNTSAWVLCVPIKKSPSDQIRCILLSDLITVLNCSIDMSCCRTWYASFANYNLWFHTFLSLLLIPSQKMQFHCNNISVEMLFEILPPFKVRKAHHAERVCCAQCFLQINGVRGRRSDRLPTDEVSLQFPYLSNAHNNARWDWVQQTKQQKIGKKTNF